jgi:hypothetical protein
MNFIKVGDKILNLDQIYGIYEMVGGGIEIDFGVIDYAVVLYKEEKDDFLAILERFYHPLTIDDKYTPLDNT